MASFTVEIAGKARTLRRLTVAELIEMTDGAYRYEYDALVRSREHLQDSDAEFRALRALQGDPSLLARFARTLTGSTTILASIGLSEEDQAALSRGKMIDVVAEACGFTVETGSDETRPTEAGNGNG